MFRLPGFVVVILVVGVSVAGCSQTSPVVVDSLTFNASPNWQMESPDHDSRKLQFRVPSGDENIEDASLVVWNLATLRDKGDGEVVERNMQRWMKQFRQDDGSPYEEGGVRTEYRINGLPVYTFEITGRYTSESSPGSGLLVDKPGYRMVGAYVTAPQGDYIIKMVGPAHVVAANSGAFGTFLRSMRSSSAPWEHVSPEKNARPNAMLTATKSAR